MIPPGPKDAAPPELRQAYLLAVSLPFFETPDGRIWLDPLWWQDLRAHFAYLKNVTVLAPRQTIIAPEAGMAEAVAPAGTQLRFVAFARQGGMKQALMDLPASIAASWRAIGNADLVHSGVAGWPFPVGLVANPIARLRRKPLIIVIESTFWRLSPGQTAGWKARLRAGLTERFARWSARRADVVIYTHKGYSDSLPPGPHGRSAVLPASWIAQTDILPPDVAAGLWTGKPLPPTFLLASRLVAQKGIETFIAALHLLEQQGIPAQIDIIGQGPLRQQIAGIAAEARHLRLRVLDPVPYGPPFMALLRNYHCALVPTIGDEQPRIIYDAFAQAVPVIASGTPGNMEVAAEGETGHFFAPGSAPDLARAICAVMEKPQDLRRMGLAALAVASEHTHAIMHRRRAELLAETFNAP